MTSSCTLLPYLISADNSTQTLQQWLMTGLLILALALLLFLYLNFRKITSSLSQSQQHNIELQEIVDRRTSEIDHLVHLDAITHFYKRRKLLPKIDEVIDKKVPLILYVINVRNLKNIDDHFGYKIGDITRNRISAIIKSIFVSEQTLFGRYYDNYYIIDYRDNTIEDSDYIINELKEVFHKTVTIEDYELPVLASVGIIEYQEGLTSLEFMNRGDIAVLEIANKPDVFFIRYNQDFHNRIRLQNSLKNDLALALENNELQLYYQPQIDISTGELYSCEALLRWIRDDGTSVPPSMFIPIAENTGQINDIGDWVINECCKTLHKWEGLGITNSIAMNVSPKQIHSDLTVKLQHSITEYNIDPSKLYLEITETALWEDFQETIRILNQIRKLGIRLALDDFGVGYSSLNHMKALKVDKLKIDKSFIDTIDQLETTAIIKAIIELGKTLNYVIIAEGVETLDQLNTLSDLNVNRIQGWYYSKALPYDAYVDYYYENKQQF